jgi:HupE / UreJ protein
MSRIALALFAVLLAAIPVTAEAHKPSDSTLSLTIEDSTVQGRWAIALRDLDYAMGLDGDGNGEITWSEVRARHKAIAAYALSRLDLHSDTEICPTTAGDQEVEDRSDGAYTVLRFTAACAGTVENFEARYLLFFDLDPQHRGLLQVDWNGVNSTTILSPARPSWRAQDGETSPWTQAAVYTQEGVWHIWIGIDHVLFLLSLLLPAVLLRGKGGVWATKKPRAAFLEVVKVVTAFTLAHSITLGLASVGWIDLPSRLIEPIIAASIVIAALNNIFPLVTRGIWLVAFGFGLVHGIGFATALSELGLPSQGLLLSLFSFNLGVEMGQLAIVAVFLPAAIWFARTRFYLPVAMRFGSLAIAAIASVWFVERAFGVSLLIT